MTKTLKAVIIISICLGLAFCASSQANIQKKQEKNPQYQYNRGTAYLNPAGGEIALDQAIKCFDKAIALDPKHYLAWNARGLAYSMKGDFKTAVQSLQKCLEINPSFSEAHNNLGTIYDAQGLFSLAEVEYDKVLTDLNYPRKENPLYNLAQMYFRQGKNDAALDFILRALKINNRFAMAYNLKGKIFDKMQLPSEAIASYEQAAKIVPEDMNFQYDLALAYFNYGDKDRVNRILSLILGKTTDPGLRVKVAELKKKMK
jgi:Tfp pilus assembly protein PilF